MVEIARNIYWNGIKDWDLRKFHGHELSTHRGSTYNSYIIKGKMTVLIDTVWTPYKEEFVEMLENDVGIDNIDAIVINHIELDHGGSLPYIMEKRPDIPIYCTKMGAEIIKGHFHQDWDFKIVKTGDSLNIGEYDLVFVEMKMLHWPDSMLTYVKGASVVFSNDAFGQHFSSQSLFNDEVDECELYQDAIKYYANILTPFSPLIKKKIEEIRALNIPIEMIAPSHGVIWRKNPTQIIDKYYEWSQSYSEDFVVIIYDTMYNSTKKMADAIAGGLRNKNVKYKMFNSSVTDSNDLITEIFKSKGILVGSCTVNGGPLHSIGGLLSVIKGLKFRGKLAAAFGSYGWGGEAPVIISEQLKEAGFKVVKDPIRVKYVPTPENLDECIRLGEIFAEML